MKIKVLTMVKNEEDIIEYWINYHGTIFGYRNIYIVDNYSDDGTYEKILKYKKVGVNISRHSDYKKKGDLMTQMIKQDNNYDIAIPLDIDEFIVHYDKNNKCLNPTHTKKYIDKYLNLKDNSVFKCNYIQSTISNNNDFGYNNALLESKYGKYEDYKELAKTFFSVKNWNGQLDHGNHYYTKDYFLTDLVLVHYHCRNLEQMKKKVRANINGLGYKEDISKLEEVLKNNENAPGSHHIKHMIKILNNTFTINTSVNGENNEDYVKLDSLVNYFLKLSLQ
jgi:hypothetical protein